MFPSSRTGVRSRVFSFVFLCAAFSFRLYAGVEDRIALKKFDRLTAPLGVGSHVRIDDVPFDGRMQSLDLERFEVFAPNAKVVVYGENGYVEQAPPAMVFYRGHVVGDPESLVYVSRSQEGIQGFALKGDRKFSIGSRARVGSRFMKDPDGVFIREIEPSEEIPFDGQTWQCDLDKITSRKLPLSPKSNSAKLKPVASALSGPSARYVLNIAVDTDYELYQNLGSSAAVTTFVTQVVAASSVIYSRDLQTDLRLIYTGVQSAVGDPFNAVPGSAGPSGTYSSFDALVELGALWHAAAPPRNISRSAATLLSGKSQRSGIAWLEVTCGGDFANGSANVPGGYGGAYSYNGGTGLDGSTVPNPEANPNNVATTSIFDNNYWTLLEFSHELGHNVQSKHTHCTPLSGADQILYGRAFVDTCFRDDDDNPATPGTNCFTDGAPLNPTAISANVPAEKGTVMSYCHLTNQYGTGIRYQFGKSGEASQTIVDLMKASLDGNAPSLSVITAPASLSIGASGGASVTNVGGLTYLWTITNGVVNSGSTTNAINFTANTNPVTLRVTATGANGCATTDVKTVTVTGSCSYAITSAQAAFSSAGGAGAFSVQTSCAWSAGSNSGFITIIAPDSGVGTGTVNYTVAPNGTGLPRTGTLTAGGLLFTVQQSAAATPTPRRRNDFNADGRSDIVWRNSASGVSTIWMMNGINIGGGSGTTALTNSTSYTIGGIGDFNGDQKADLLWRNSATGDNIMWLMDGVNVLAGSGPLPNVPGTFQVGGVGDFNADGKSDIVWRSTATGVNSMWLMNGTSILAGSGSLLTIADLNFSVGGIGDFNNDGRSDILWRNDSTGTSVIWMMNGTSIGAGSGTIPLVIDSTWRAVNVGDLNGDAYSDIMWRNTGTGQNVLWLMNGLSILVGSGEMLQVADLNYRVASTGDFNADGREDLVWRNDTTGISSIWLMNGTTIGAGSGTLLTVAPPFTVVTTK